MRVSSFVAISLLVDETDGEMDLTSLELSLGGFRRFAFGWSIPFPKLAIDRLFFFSIALDDD